MISILARMEDAGVRVDSKRLSELSREFAGRLATLEEDIYKHAGGPFNINSGPQLAGGPVHQAEASHCPEDARR